ncbi:DUF3592 domain-containing protein [Selenomonas ruminantium]|uniref:DUF3592 domain-containing protein n=1 Tax=Selenomonas ruminantium TaxID=971 RepID=A0A1H0R9H7_SELRU|nr:DUF3592 domain-containing protein [Selenomonas ruminantium]SDP25696.1 hypothetical protein SAMN05216366_11116 [Selenomonas ruminantium]
MSEWLLAPAFIMLVGVIFILVAVGIKWKIKKKLAVCTAETKGTVVRWSHERVAHDYGSATDYFWFPVYAYDVQGKHYEEKSSVGLSEQGELYAETVLYYEPGNPSNFYANIGNYDRLIMIFRLVGWSLTLMTLLTLGILYHVQS